VARIAMGKLRLQPREFRLRAGARSEVDRRFLQIVNLLPENINLSEFIKKTVVTYYEEQSKFSKADKLQQDFFEIQEQLGQFVENLQKVAKTIPNEEKFKIIVIRDKMEILFNNLLESMENVS
jgi:archaellin